LKGTGLVSRKKVKEKVPALLVDGSVSDSMNEYMGKRYWWEQLRRKQPSKYSGFENNLVNLLEEIDKAFEDMKKRCTL